MFFHFAICDIDSVNISRGASLGHIHYIAYSDSMQIPLVYGQFGGDFRINLILDIIAHIDWLTLDWTLFFLTEALFDIYIGDPPVSLDAKHEIAERVCQLLRAEFGTNWTLLLQDAHSFIRSFQRICTCTFIQIEDWFSLYHYSYFFLTTS